VKADTKRILGIHVGLFVAEAICISAFVVEIDRALSGNTLSWAYVFEWPIFAIYAVYLWHKLRQEEHHDVAPPPSAPEPGNDRALEDYNEYLREVHRTAKDDPPGSAP
jgi:hypothetical protein